MKICVPKEVYTGEKRVATTPDVTAQLIKLGFTVAVESGAGLSASFSDDAYESAGAEIIRDTADIWLSADIILKVRAPEQSEIDQMKASQTLISFIWPAQNQSLMEQLAAKKVTVLAMDSVPRISRAQKLDALSSMANIAGYRAVVEAANHFGRFFTGQITAAGKIPPAKVMVIGAGVAGLAVIGTANSLGAIVRAFDTRPEVKEQVESMDAEFLELDYEEEGSGEGGYAKVMSDEFIKAEMELFAAQAKEVDIIITTALIPGKPAPELITEDMVKSMKDGSVIVDLAAEQGGNCKLTEPDQVMTHHGVTIIGYTDLPSRLPTQSSQLYATNIRHLLADMCPDKNGEINVDMEDEVIRGTTVIKNGEITWPPPAPKLSAAPKKAPEKKPAVEVKEIKKPGVLSYLIPFIAGGLALFGLGLVAPPEFMQHFTVFVLACFVGYMVIWNVTPSLHTPLMSVTNAISSIIIIGALLQISSENKTIMILAAIAILITSVNIFGGFAVTQRMLQMFRK
ncbi:MAG: Re/Si-specific NAD(P)(+) transhydrogenase subunit alpha [Gammaproteobacteria bacterium]|nr:Re/Si-specific NAD(P)(+) transhydrogenase subunit alpha [Gammaproteobacteria bacterium]NIN61612.1 Re/Si-specific NAD(P)(+) transhydrogenase subunit alpha [Gammaproteobacteria bacterium]NIO62806.1 Re/Si-specific NAD(P)(+) transhydrogenase subunit alpha [Gammaproteobacteria bacterium]NIQ09555.1 Re/Si-specific NAD(P)(+) transhydrogenase subunit alpha [Gammaproteobacteria bacterium]NIQ19370.1 Re/Si-specific NAD(P)(+) transhydrogenase subunit alpha [Gammaproteobacteria bacterium]